MTRVVVVGGGIIGLTSALALLESGYARVHVVAASFDDNVSHVAGAIWMPFALPASMDPYKPKLWCEASMAWLTTLLDTYGEQATGIHFVKGVDASGEGAPSVVHPYWAHCVKDFRLLSADEAAKISADTAHGFAFETIIYNPTTLMAFLTAQIKARGGTFETRHVDDLDTIDCDVLVNCTGLGAKELVHDDSNYPIRGQTIKVYNPKITTFTMVVHADSQHTYILPRTNGEVVLGGTVQPHNGNASSDDADAKAIWERCCQVNPEVRNSKVLLKRAGLRPGRTNGVRLELDPRGATAKGALLIHNYGHAGSGHTLQWGCAQDVVRLAKLHRPPQSAQSRL
ncbi:D-aspartate oxidase, partial [Globisporangium splendens]